MIKLTKNIEVRHFLFDIRIQGNFCLFENLGEDKGRSVYSRGFFISDPVEMKYLKIEIIHWALFLQLVLIFISFLVTFWKKIYEIKFDKEINEIIFFFNWLHFSMIFAIIWAFTAFWEINSNEMASFWISTLI